MAEIRQLQMDGVDILPVTHESAVVDNNGTAISAKYQPKSDSSLTTSTKTVVGAINEINNNKLEAGDQHSTVGSVKVRYMKYNGENFYPMTHTSAILDANGAVLSTTLSTLMTSINTTLPNKVSTLETNYTSVKSTSDTLKTTASTLSTSVGTLSSLQTTAKGNLVAAINEVFQLGNNARSRLAAALIAKGCEDITASSSLEDILTVIESNSVVSGLEGWSVESVSGVTYGFNSVQSGTLTYWQSTNSGDNTYSLCKLIINNPNGKNVYLNVQQSSEYGYDYGVLSNLNSPLDTTSINDSSYYRSWKGISSTSWQTESLGAVNGWYHIKYRKDSSSSSGGDYFRFYVTFD